jgi:predicted ribosome quality control (RQC) complex YloA/Tae2 family protein
MEISAIEIHLLCKKISQSISDYFVSGIYSIEEGMLLRVNHATKPEKLIAVSSFATWITTKNLSIPQATKFVSRLRILERFALEAVEQVGNERIAKFSLKGRKDEKRNLCAEFFARGNLILTDPDAGELILDVEKPQTFRHRSLQVGEKYSLPPSRGVPLQDLDEQALVSLHTAYKTGVGEDLSAIKWFGRSVGTSRKFVEEIFFRAGVDPEVPSQSLTAENLRTLALASARLRVDLENSEEGYVLLPSEESELDVDVCPFVPKSWEKVVEEHLATITKFPSLSDALDEVLVQEIILKKRRSVSQKTRAKAAELSSALAKQAAQIESNRKIATELRALAKNLMTSANQEIEPTNEIVSKLLSYDLVELGKDSGNQVRFSTEPRSFLKSYSGTALGSRLFDEAKRLDSETRQIEEIMRDLQEQKDNLVETTRSQEEKAERKLVTERRERQWFERYRWFVTSDGKLALGGRDSTSNSIVVNKYTEKNDVAFHADLYGSPFFILKNEVSLESPLSDEIALEMAQATVSFSRAWKDELGSADAYWVYPDQIKKSAPSGEYLPRGSFFIEGKKNFVRHVKVELSVGIMSASSLPSIEKKLEANQIEKSVSDYGSLLLVCGPDKSLGPYCYSRARIAPGKERGTIFARRLKQQLVNRIKNNDVKEAAKKLSLDEIMRVLPSGGYKLVSEKQNH